MDIVNLIISLVSGAIGGNIAGAAMPNKSLGGVGNSIAGIVGGGLGHYIMQAVGILSASGGDLTLGSILGNIGSGGIGGAILLIIVALLKGMFTKKA